MSTEKEIELDRLINITNSIFAEWDRKYKEETKEAELDDFFGEEN